MVPELRWLETRFGDKSLVDNRVCDRLAARSVWVPGCERIKAD
jgi:hypothetical protein